MQSRAQAGKLVTRAHGEDFYGAIGVVPHPSGNAEEMRFPLHEPAKTDSLYTPSDQETAGMGVGLRGGGHIPAFQDKGFVEKSLVEKERKTFHPRGTETRRNRLGIFRLGSSL